MGNIIDFIVLVFQIILGSILFILRFTLILIILPLINISFFISSLWILVALLFGIIISILYFYDVSLDYLFFYTMIGVNILYAGVVFSLAIFLMKVISYLSDDEVDFYFFDF